MRGDRSFEDEEESGIHLFGFLSCSPSESISDALWKVGKRVQPIIGWNPWRICLNGTPENL